MDTNMQYAFLINIRDFVPRNGDGLDEPVTNPEGDDRPNKERFDPRVWKRSGEQTMAARVKMVIVDFNCDGSLTLLPVAQQTLPLHQCLCTYRPERSSAVAYLSRR